MNPLTIVTDTINRILIILMVLTALVVVVAIIVIWGKYKALSPGQQWLIKLAIFLAGLVFALSAGWLAQEDLRKLGIPTSWDELTGLASDIFMRFDGWIREHQWLGALLLALGPVLLWPRDSEARNVAASDD